MAAGNHQRWAGLKHEIRMELLESPLVPGRVVGGSVVGLGGKEGRTRCCVGPGRRIVEVCTTGCARNISQENFKNETKHFRTILDT